MRALEDENNNAPTGSDADAAGQAPARPRVARLFQEFAPAVRAFLLRRLGNIEDAREGAQEIFLNLWRREQQGGLEHEARAYLFASAENWVRDCRRRARRHGVDKHDSTQENNPIPDPSPGGEDVVHWQRGLEMVTRSIEELPRETQRIFEMHHIAGMTYSQIARELGITTRTVERHMANAIAHCKLRLKAYL